MVEKGRGQKGIEGGNRSPRDHLVWSGLYASSTAIVSTTPEGYCALVSLNLTEGEYLMSAGKLHDHYFFKCVIDTNDDRKCSSYGKPVEKGLLSSASTSWLPPPFPHRPLFTCSCRHFAHTNCRLTPLHTSSHTSSAHLSPRHTSLHCYHLHIPLKHSYVFLHQNIQPQVDNPKGHTEI